MRTLFLYSCDGGPNDGEQRATSVDHPESLDPCDVTDLEASFYPVLDHPNKCSIFVVQLRAEGGGLILDVTNEDGDEVFQTLSSIEVE